MTNEHLLYTVEKHKRLCFAVTVYTAPHLNQNACAHSVHITLRIRATKNIERTMFSVDRDFVHEIFVT